MKKYSFRLETLRRVRRIEEDTAKAALLNANSAVQLAIFAVEQRVGDYGRHISLNGTSGPGEATSGVDDFMKRRYFNELAGQALVLARQAQVNAEAVALVKRNEWSAAAMKVKALDRLDEHRKDEFRVEHERDLEKEVDDMIIARSTATNNARRRVAS